MAIVVETLVPHASKAEAENFDATVEAAMMQRGGPPAGLMVHFTRPVGDGFALSNVWRSEAEMPLGVDHPIPPDAAAAAADRVLNTPAPIRRWKQPRDVRFVATDTDWAFGSGHEVHATMGTHLFTLTGRLPIPQASSTPA